MQARKSNSYLPSRQSNHTLEFVNSSVMTMTNHQSAISLIGFVASLSSVGVALTLQKPAQATIFQSNEQSLIAELPSLSSYPTILNSESTLESDLSHNSSERYISTIVATINSDSLIPQLPPLQIAQVQQKKLTKKIHTVRSGETIAGIARQYGISSSQIIEANQLSNPNFIKINRQLIIPDLELAQETNYRASESNSTTPFSSLVKTKIESRSQKTIPAITVNTSSSSEESTYSDRSERDLHISKLRQDIIKLRDKYQTQNGSSHTATITNPTARNLPTTIPARENFSAPEIAKPNSTSLEPPTESASTSRENIDTLISLANTKPFIPNLPPLAPPEEYLPDNPVFEGYIWPAQGTFTSGYGWRWGRMHKGIDIAAPIGTPIIAAASGEVIFAGWNSGGYGNLVKLKHPDGSVTFYAHNNRVLVRSGQKVRQGELIAEMGSTGRSTGPHLHFEIRPNGTNAINPIALLPKR